MLIKTIPALLIYIYKIVYMIHCGSRGLGHQVCSDYLRSMEKEFADEIDGWIIDELKRVGLDTAKSVLALIAEELVKRTDVEENTVEEVLGVLRAEFE